jgi:hypothetical protein
MMMIIIIIITVVARVGQYQRVKIEGCKVIGAIGLRKLKFTMNVPT